MSELATLEPETALATFRPIEVTIADLQKRHGGLTINGLKDKDGYKAVHTARIEVKGVRVGIEKTRKEVKSAVVKLGQAIDGEAARLTEQIAPLEGYLQHEQDLIDAEKERIRFVEEIARKARIQVRIDAFRALKIMPPIDVADMTEEDYQASYAHWKLEAFKRDEAEAAERKRLADEAEELRLERLDIDRLRAEYEEQRKRNERLEKEDYARMMAEQKKLADEQEAQRRAVELENARKDAALKAVAETEARMTLEAEAKRLEVERVERVRQQEQEAEAARVAAQRKADEEAKAKAEAEKPLRDKILAVASELEIMCPAIETNRIWTKVFKCVEKAAADIRKIANGPLE